MECNKDEATRAKEIAEKKFMANDFDGAKKLVLKAQKLCPQLEGLTPFLEVIDVHLSSKEKINEKEYNWYGILGIDRLATVDTIKKQYKRKAFLLHPDKNKARGAEAAFKLVSEAWQVLSNKEKKGKYDKIPDDRVSTINLETPDNKSGAFHNFCESSNTPRAEGSCAQPSAFPKFFGVANFFNGSKSLRDDNYMEKPAHNPSASHDLFGSQSSPNLEGHGKRPGFGNFFGSFGKRKLPKFSCAAAGYTTSAYHEIPTSRTGSENFLPSRPQRESEPILPKFSRAEESRAQPSAFPKFFGIPNFFNSSKTLRDDNDLEKPVHYPSASHDLFGSQSSPNLEGHGKRPGFQNLGSFGKPNLPKFSCAAVGYTTYQTRAYHEIPTSRAGSKNVPPLRPLRESEPIAHLCLVPGQTFWTWCCGCKVYFELKKRFLLMKVVCCNCWMVYVAREVPAQIIRNASSRSSGSRSVPVPESGATQAATGGTPSGYGCGNGDSEATNKRKRN